MTILNPKTSVIKLPIPFIIYKLFPTLKSKSLKDLICIEYTDVL